MRYVYSDYRKKSVIDTENGVFNITEDSPLWKEVLEWISEGNEIGEPTSKEEVDRVSTLKALSDSSRIERYSDIEVDGITFWADRDSVNGYLLQLRRFDKNSKLVIRNFKASDNTWIDLTQEMLEKVIDAINTRNDTVFSKVKEKDKEIKGSSDPLSVSIN